MILQNKIIKVSRFALIFLFIYSNSSCSDTEGQHQLFELLPAKETGLDFSNDLTFSRDFNVYKYRNYYNGGGVALGDINNDGLLDVYLTANQKQNRLYINKGNFEFEDITEKSGTGGQRPWSTGVTMVDINADGFLDIYVCNSGNIKGSDKKNELFINNGNLTFTESADDFNLGDKGYSTHASFFDYDKDGDLDAYLLNNSYQAIGSFNLTTNERPKRDYMGGDKLMENREGKFFDVSEQAGVFGSVIGFGLGVSIGDVNGDNWEDIYVSNDFFERDYLYINQKNGTFIESLTDQVRSISGASMGSDMADVNNDGMNEIFVTEMLPSDYQRLKTVTTFEDWDTYSKNVRNDYYHQFTRNTFQSNNGNNTFSEIGRFSGIEASDWSWGALFFDMNNNGLKDLFISNGIYKDLTNQDYLQYVSNEAVIRSITTDKQIDFKKLIDIIPSNKVNNHAFINEGDFKFRRGIETGLNTLGFSNGSAFGDLDNDGDFDLIVNNVNMDCFVYRNNLNHTNANYIKLVLEGEGLNKNAFGAEIEITSKNGDQFYFEQQPARGFQSSIDNRPNIGVGMNDSVNVKIIWPKGTVTSLTNVAVNQTLIVNEQETAEIDVDQENIKVPDLFTKAKNSIAFEHRENYFSDFNKNRLIIQMYSSLGPKTSMGDIDNDGYEDLFIGGSKGYAPVIMEGSSENFIGQEMSVFEEHKNSEDSNSHFFDADNDGDLDLYVCSGGIEFNKFSEDLADRLYINNGKGKFEISMQKLPSDTDYFSTGTVVSSDIDNDGDLDLFIGERMNPEKYGLPCTGFILRNNGKGVFEEVTETVASELKNIGMITDALFYDFDVDGDEDLLIVGEFMGIEIFKNENGIFNKMKENPLAKLKGWWNAIGMSDLDNDGDMDIIIGNHGLNSRFKATEANPITLYLKDFDFNGSLDPILTFRSDNGKDYPFELRHNLINQIKNLKKKFPDYKSFENADINSIFKEKELKDAITLSANRLQTTLLMNNGNFDFDIVELPNDVQYSPVYAFEFHDFDKDGDIDIVYGGNLYKVKPEYGRYDASYGGFLENQGNMKFRHIKDGKGFSIKGEIRDLLVHKNELIVIRNNDSIAVFEFK
jgi:hypothetical protein